MRKKVMFGLQICSLAFIWIFVLAIYGWILSILAVSRQLDDAINASLAIGIIAIPLFLAIAVLLTYVFVGLQRHRRIGSGLVENPGATDLD